MADPMLPPEYQDQLDAFMRKQKLAQILQARAQNMQAPAQGPVASRISPFSALAGLGSGVLGGYMGNQADEGIRGVQKQYTADEASDVSKMLASPEDQRINMGLNSKFQRSRDLAKIFQTQDEKRRELGSKVYSEAGDTPNALAALRGTPVGPSTPPKKADVTWVAGPDGKILPKTTNYDKHGIEHVTLGASGTNVSTEVKLPSDEVKDANKREQEDLAAMQAKARTGQASLATATRLNKVLEENADAGGGASLRQTARKFLSNFGVDLPETGPTDTAKQLFGRGLLENAKSLGINPTDADAKRIEDIVGTIDTDPASMPRLIALMAANGHKAMQDFNQFVKIKRGGQAAKLYPGLYETADVGIRQPEKLFGSQDLQMRTMEALQQAGGDVSQFQANEIDPKTGKAAMTPFPSDATFTLSPPKAVQKPQSTQAPLSVKAPNGKTYSFPDAAAMERFKKAAGIP